MATCGRRKCFHGAFGTRSKAERKAAGRRGAAILVRRIRKQTRFVVVTDK
jgi:hypothetical protein